MSKRQAYSVLILDDQEMVLRPLERALRAKGFIVWATTKPKEALAAVEGHRPSVVCIDLEMPRMNGIQVIQKMRQLVPDIRIIVVTGHLADYRKDVEALKLRVVEKDLRYGRKLEAVIAAELELSKKDVDGLKTRAKPKSRLRILFVDDEIEQADFFCEIVSSMGAEADSCQSYEEAVGKAKLFRPNVLCTDLMMRDVNGDELIRRMKPSGDFPFIQAYAGITGFNEKKDYLIQAGATDVLIKPVQLDEFLECMKKWEDLIKSG